MARGRDEFRTERCCGMETNPALPSAPPRRLSAWRLTSVPTQVLIDFSPKGGPKDLVGKWDVDGITFPDGNKWTKKKEVVVKKEPYVFRPTNARVQAPEPVEE